ncbi:hypothetical protein ACX122_17500 [Kosakonia cowanii]
MLQEKLYLCPVIVQGPLTGINQAASDLARKGLLVVDGKVWRTVYYRMVTDDEKEGRRSTNRIFQECRNSEAMKRVLAVYGRVQA